MINTDVRLMRKAEKILNDDRLQEVLSVLAKTDASVYQIKKQTGMPHSTAHKKVDKAQKYGFIRLKEERKFRTGLQNKIYEITPSGLIVYLCKFFEKNRESKLPLKVSEKINESLFDKWNEFLRHVPYGYALAILQAVTERLFMHAIERNTADIKQLFLNEFIECLGVPNIWVHGDPPIEGIAAFLSKFPEIKEIFLDGVDEEINSLKIMLRYWEDVYMKVTWHKHKTK